MYGVPQIYSGIRVLHRSSAPEGQRSVSAAARFEPQNDPEEIPLYRVLHD